MTTEEQKDIIDESLTNLLQTLPAPVAARVREKYEADRESFLELVNRMKPSTKPDYWAKHSCAFCYGRGIVGRVTMPDGSQNAIICKCTEKKYAKWIKEMRAYYNSLKGPENEQISTQET